MPSYVVKGQTSPTRGTCQLQESHDRIAHQGTENIGLFSKDIKSMDDVFVREPAAAR